jgi:hypothetical protein
MNPGLIWSECNWPVGSLLLTIETTNRLPFLCVSSVMLLDWIDFLPSGGSWSASGLCRIRKVRRDHSIVERQCGSYTVDWIDVSNPIQHRHFRGYERRTACIRNIYSGKGPRHCNCFVTNFWASVQTQSTCHIVPGCMNSHQHPAGGHEIPGRTS